ncbi:putative zinc-binding protein [Massilia sp. X63]|uniref:putative zinc-binding protein n=1 Tax=Massilia sp. X63 TaxID=3237285 RepID=UPI0034DD4AD8
MAKDRASLPLVYSCSGCSSAAQMANHVALALDRLGVAEMSCIAGVGGDVPSLVKLAKSGRPVAVIDGCPLVCARSCLARHGVEPDMHWQLGEHGVKKRYHAGFDPEQAEAMVARVAAQAGLLQRVPEAAAPDAPVPSASALS